MTWLLLGVGGAALAGGIGLAVHAQARADEAFALANQPKLKEYAPEARDAEDAARGSRTGAIVCFSLSAAALVAAIVVWRRGGPDRAQPVRVGVAPAGLSITY